MTIQLVVRRIAIFAACLLAIAGVVVVVRTAAVLRADAAPLVAPPVSAEQIAAEIDAESARATDLAAALAELETRAGGLDQGLTAVGDQMTADSHTAEQLRADIAAAQERLATLQGQLATAQARLTRLQNTAGPATTTNAEAAVTSGHEEEHEEHEGEEHDD